MSHFVPFIWCNLRLLVVGRCRRPSFDFIHELPEKNPVSFDPKLGPSPPFVFCVPSFVFSVFAPSHLRVSETQITITFPVLKKEALRLRILFLFVCFFVICTHRERTWNLLVPSCIQVIVVFINSRFHCQNIFFLLQIKRMQKKDKRWKPEAHAGAVTEKRTLEKKVRTIQWAFSRDCATL